MYNHGLSWIFMDFHYFYGLSWSLMDFHRVSWRIFMDYHRFSWIFIDFHRFTLLKLVEYKSRILCKDRLVCNRLVIRVLPYSFNHQTTEKTVRKPKPFTSRKLKHLLINKFEYKSTWKDSFSYFIFFLNYFFISQTSMKLIFCSRFF